MTATMRAPRGPRPWQRLAQRRPHHRRTPIRLSDRDRRLYESGQAMVGAVHDLGNIFGAILGYMELALEVLPAEHAAHELIGCAHEAARRADQLRAWLLAFVRGDRSVTQPLDLATFVAEEAPILRRLIGSHITIALDLAANVPILVLDPIRVRRVLLNLVLNACDALPAGGRIGITVAAADGAVVLEIADNGCGMSPAVLRRCFEPFYTTKRAGSGMGLALCRRIVAKCGGTIGAESAIGEGTVVRVMLPAG